MLRVEQVWVSSGCELPMHPYSLVCSKDFPIRGQWIWDLWQTRKCTTEQAQQMLLESRSKGSLDLSNLIATTHRLEVQADMQNDKVWVQKKLFSKLVNFRPDPRIDTFLKQFGAEQYGNVHRTKVLGLFGGSNIGKSCKALSVFGFEKTLKVSCNPSKSAN